MGDKGGNWRTALMGTLLGRPCLDYAVEFWVPCLNGNVAAVQWPEVQKTL